MTCCYINWARLRPHIYPLPHVLNPSVALFSSTRVKKLRETLVAVQQLDKNMSSLRSWLAHIETELSRPIVYDTCDDQEIQRKLNQQQASGTTHKAVVGYKNAKQNCLLMCLLASEECEMNQHILCSGVKKICSVWPMWYVVITCGNLPHILPDLQAPSHTHKQAQMYFVRMYFSVNTKLYQNNMTQTKLVENEWHWTTWGNHSMTQTYISGCLFRVSL